MNKQFKNKVTIIWPIVAILLLTLVVSLNLSSNPFSNHLPRHDSSMFTYFGVAMDQGKLMYKDIFDHKGPLIFILNYLGELLSTSNFSGIYIIEVLSIFLFLYFSFKTARLWLTPLLSLVPIVIQTIILSVFIEGGNFTEEYALPFISFSIYQFIKFYKKDKQISSINIFLIGLSVGLVLLLRPNMITVWAVFCLLILVDLISSKEFNFIFKIIIFFTSGLILSMLPFIIYMLKEGILSQAIFQSLTFNFKYLGSVSGREEGIIKLLDTVSMNYISLLAAYTLISFCYKKNRLSRNEKYIYIGSLLSLCLSFISSAMSGRNYTHYLMVLLPTLIVPLTLLLNDLPTKMKARKLILMSSAFVAIIYFNQLYETYNYMYETNIVQTDIGEEMSIRERRSIAIGKENNILNEVAKIIKENTKETDEIYVHRTGGNIYLLSERLSSIKYFNLPAVNINENKVIGNDFLNEIKDSNTKIIVLKSSFVNQEKYEIEKEFYEFVTNNYYEIYSENGYYIYSENDKV